MSTQAPQHYESAVRAMSEAAAETELTHAPVRLAYWRMTALDALLARLEELRVAAEREVPDDILELVTAYAARHDAELSSCIRRLEFADLIAQRVRKPVRRLRRPPARGSCRGPASSGRGAARRAEA